MSVGVLEDQRNDGSGERGEGNLSGGAWAGSGGGSKTRARNAREAGQRRSCRAKRGVRMGQVRPEIPGESEQVEEAVEEEGQEEEGEEEEDERDEEHAEQEEESDNFHYAYSSGYRTTSKSARNRWIKQEKQRIYAQRGFLGKKIRFDSSDALNEGGGWISKRWCLGSLFGTEGQICFACSGRWNAAR